jgi:hypothetical protein
MTFELDLCRLRDSLVSMSPRQLIESEQLVSELRERMEKASPAEAARWLPMVRQAHLLAETAEMLLGSLPDVARAGAAYTAFGTRAGVSSGTILRA